MLEVGTDTCAALQASSSASGSSGQGWTPRRGQWGRWVAFQKEEIKEGEAQAARSLLTD